MEPQTKLNGGRDEELESDDIKGNLEQKRQTSQEVEIDGPKPIVTKVAVDEQNEHLDNEDMENETPQKEPEETRGNDTGTTVTKGKNGETLYCGQSLKKSTSLSKEKQQEIGMSFRAKVMRTACAQAAYLGVTLNLGMIGPSMLDLEMLTHSTTQQMSTVFTWRAVLGLVASLLLGPLLDHVNRFFIVGVALAADVLFIAAAPWTNHIAALLATMAPPEFFNSAIGMGTHLICLSTWGKDSGPSLQALNLMATIGYTISPLLCKPFLAPPQEDNNLNRNSSLSAQMNISFQNISENKPSGPMYKFVSNNLTVVTEEHMSVNEPGTNIQYAYLIVAIYDLLIACFTFVLFIKDGGKVKLPKDEKDSKEENLEQKSTEKFVITICILFFFFNVFYGGIEVGYAGLLMTFAVKHLGWSKADGTNVTAVLQASNAIVTALAILISKWVRAPVMLAWSIGIVTVAMLVLSLAAEYSSVVLWVCTACLGVGYATIMPCSYTWVNDVMEVTGKFSSAYWAGFFTGFMLVPAITGQLFYLVHPMWLPYATLMCSVGMSIMFTIISIVIWKRNRLQGKEV